MSGAPMNRAERRRAERAARKASQNRPSPMPAAGPEPDASEAEMARWPTILRLKNIHDMKELAVAYGESVRSVEFVFECLDYELPRSAVSISAEDDTPSGWTISFLYGPAWHPSVAWDLDKVLSWVTLDCSDEVEGRDGKADMLRLADILDQHAARIRAMAEAWTGTP